MTGRVTRECSQCHRLAPIFALNLCGICYSKAHPRPMKECVNCHELRPHCAKGMCTPCYKKLVQRPDHYARNKDVILAKAAEWRSQHTEHMAEYFRQRYAASDKDVEREKRRQNYQQHRAERREKGRAYYRLNKHIWKNMNRTVITCRNCEAVAPLMARGMCGPCYLAWYTQQAVTCKQCGVVGPYGRRDLCRSCTVKKVYAANRPRYLLYYNRRRARRKALPDTLTRDQWEAIKARHDHRCVYCGERPNTLSMDHVIPLSRGGGTTAENIVPACLSCNKSKRDRTPAEWSGRRSR